MKRRALLRTLALPVALAAVRAGAADRAAAKSLPAWVPQPGMRKSISLNTLADVDPCPARDCRHTGVVGQQAVLSAWCGAAFATDYGALGAWVTTGGGHGDYYGNEVYAFELDTLRWKRLNEPFDGGRDSDVDYAEGEYAFGIPLSTHTYQHTQYVPRRFGGGEKGSLITVVAYGAGRHARGSGRAHACDLATGRWTRFSVNKATVAISRPSATALDTGRALVWRVPTDGARIETLDLRERRFRIHDVPGGPTFRVHHTCGFDEARDALVVLDWRAQPKLAGWMLDCAAPTQWRRLKFIGDLPPPGTDGMSLEWCPPLRCLVGYEGNGATVVRKLWPAGDGDPTVWRWEAEPIGGDPPVHRRRPPRQTFSRFRWAPSIACFLWVDDRRSAAQAWRLRGT